MDRTYLSDLEVARRYGVHRSTPWRWVKTDPAFPKPIVLSPGCTRWKLADLVAWEESREHSQ
jgi:prophage regulatory protein